MDFDQTWYILSPYESGTLLIFKVKGQGHRVYILGEGIRNALRCPCYILNMNIMTKDKEKYICVHSLQIIRLVLSQDFWIVKALPHLFYIHIGV
jgi:hypothetical protein